MFHSLFKNPKLSIKTGKSDKDQDSSQSRSSTLNRTTVGRYSGSRSGRRLVRSQRIQGLRHLDDDRINDASRNSEHLSETVSMSSTWGTPSPFPSIFPSDDVTYMPLPSPISINAHHSAQEDAPVFSPRSWDGDMRDSDENSGYLSDSALSDCSFQSSASPAIFFAVTRDVQSLPGTHIENPAGVGSGLQRLDQGYGSGLQIRTHVEKSAPSSTRTSPVSSPKAWGSSGSQWPWSSGSCNLQQGSSLTSLESSYEKSTWVDAHPLPPPPTLNTAPASPHAPLCSPRSKLDSGPTVCKWQKGRLLGSGAFGRVYKGIHLVTGEFCAIKEVEYGEDDPKSKESAKQLEQEIRLLSSLRHPNIVHYKGSEIVNGRLNIYLELVMGGSIYKLCQEFKKLEEPVVRRYTRQILLGLHFLHNRKTVHRDIKGANILVDQEGTVKLADFGMAKQIKQIGGEFLSFKGSPNWMAPEVIMQKKTGFEFAIDIWSLGCTVLEMVTGRPPWSEYEGVAAMFKVTRAEIPPFPQSLSREGQSFIRLCMQRDPEDRPSATALLQHPFVQIPNDYPDYPTQAINIQDYLSSGIEERSTTQQNSSSVIGLLKGGSQQLNIRQSPRGRLRQDICPTRSAPVSPRSSHNFMNEFSSAVRAPLPKSLPPAGSPRRTGFFTPPAGSPRGTGFSTPPASSPRRTGLSTSPAGSPKGTGFSTPPAGSPRGTGFSTSPGVSLRGTGFPRSPANIPRVTGFDFYTNHETSSYATDVNVGRQQHASSRLPSSSIHDVASRSDPPWDVINENRQIPRESNSRSDGLPYSSVHDVVNRSDLHFDLEYDNRQIPYKGTLRSNGFYRTEDVWSYGEEGQGYSRQKYKTLQQMDENVTQVFLERS